MLLLWCSMAKIKGYLVIEILFSKVSPQGKKKACYMYDPPCESYSVFLCELHQEFDVLERRYTKQPFILIYKETKARQRVLQRHMETPRH